MQQIEATSKSPPTKKRTRQKRPGRPEGGSNLKEHILDAAELVFSELGYAGTSLRTIADKVGATQALVSYYFGSKYGLFEAVFLRRGRPISDARIKELKSLGTDGRVPTVEEIVTAFLNPIRALRGTPEGRAFIRLQARLHTEPPEISYPLRNQAYDSSTRMYVQAFRAALPELTEKEALWRVTLMIGSYLYAFSDTHRLDQVAPGICNPADSAEVMEQMIAFVSAGFRAGMPKS